MHQQLFGDNSYYTDDSSSGIDRGMDEDTKGRGGGEFIIYRQEHSTEGPFNTRRQEEPRISACVQSYTLVGIGQSAASSLDLDPEKWVSLFLSIYLSPSLRYLHSVRLSCLSGGQERSPRKEEVSSRLRNSTGLSTFHRGLCKQTS